MALSYSGAVEEIKSRCNIVDVISPLVPLKKTGSNWKGCCPFHKEKTPSFVVSDTKQHYHCFGCGEGGDAIKFIQKYYNLSFTEAVDRLAAQYGITIDTYKNEQVKKKDPYYEVNRLAARYFFDILSKSANRGYAYMSGRGLDAKTMQFFGIGYTGEERDGLTRYLISKGIDKKMLVELGLSKVSEKNGRMYDVYRNRVMFPIFNVRGNLIGFGGRTLEKDAEPKYLNSSDSFIFEKRNNLYGLNRTKDAIQREGFAIIVEGYMDCVSLYKHGVENVAASLGTALTEQQAKLISRYTKKVVLCYDADNAGIKAALRGIDVLRAADLDVSVLHVDDGKDPDEYIKKHGKDDFINLVKTKAVPDIDYKVANLRKNYSLSDHTQSIKFLRGVAEILRVLSPVEADIYIQRIAKNYGISEGALKREVEGAATAADPPSEKFIEQREERQKEKERTEADLNIERMLIRLIMLDSRYFEKLKDYPEAFVTEEGRNIKSAFSEHFRDGTDFDAKELQNSLEEPEFAFLSEIMRDTQTAENNESAFEDCIRKLDQKRKAARIKEIYEILELSDSLPEEDINQEQIEKLMKELMELQSK